MKFLNQAQLLGIPLSWELIRCAWDGTNELPRGVTVRVIQDFALAQTESASGNELRRLADLTSQDDYEEISKALYHLAPEISDRAQRAFRLMRVHRVLDQLPSDPLEGLMELTSFWGSLEFPLDSPHIVQGRDNSIRPEEYFTQGFFREILDRHNEWVRGELSFLRR